MNRSLDLDGCIRVGRGRPAASLAFIAQRYLDWHPDYFLAAHGTLPMQRILELVAENIARSTGQTSDSVHRILSPLREDLERPCAGLEPCGLLKAPCGADPARTVGETNLNGLVPPDASQLLERWCDLLRQSMQAAEALEENCGDFHRLLAPHLPDIDRCIAARFPGSSRYREDLRREVWMGAWAHFKLAGNLPGSTLFRLTRHACDRLGQCLDRDSPARPPEEVRVGTLRTRPRPQIPPGRRQMALAFYDDLVAEEASLVRVRVWRDIRASTDATWRILSLMAIDLLDQAPEEVWTGWQQATLWGMARDLESKLRASSLLPESEVEALVTAMRERLGRPCRDRPGLVEGDRTLSKCLKTAGRGSAAEELGRQAQAILSAAQGSLRRHCERLFREWRLEP